MERKEQFATQIGKAIDGKFFQRHVTIDDLWVVDKRRYEKYEPVTIKHKVSNMTHCSVPFGALLEEYGNMKGVAHQPADALMTIFQQFLPWHWYVFKDEYGPLRLLQVNDYVLDKAFVFGVIALSKWLGETRFPQGIYKWPPSRESMA